MNSVFIALFPVNNELNTLNDNGTTDEKKKRGSDSPRTIHVLKLLFCFPLQVRSGEPNGNLQWSPDQEAPSREAASNPVLVYAHAKQNQGVSAVVPPAPTIQQPVADHFLLTIEIISLLLLLLFLLRSASLIWKMSIFRTEAILEISDGKSFVDIFLLTLTYCPTEYYLIMKQWVRSLNLLKSTFVTDDLEINWQAFHLTIKRTNECLELPRTVKLSLWQNYRLKKIINQGDYTVNLKLVHGGRAVYLAKAKFGQFEREVGVPTNHRNDYPTIHGPEYIKNQTFRVRTAQPSAPTHLYPSATQLTEVD